MADRARVAAVLSAVGTTVPDYTDQGEPSEDDVKAATALGADPADPGVAGLASWLRGEGDGD